MKDFDQGLALACICALVDDHLQLALPFEDRPGQA
jgi:hypothetical protein